MKAHYQQLFAYDAWANERIIAGIQQLSTPDEKCLYLFTHIVAAQEIWHSRIINQAIPMGPFPNRSFQESIDGFHKISNSWGAYLNTSGEDEIERLVTYKNIKGEQYSSVVKDILTHVINHSTYHRAQIVSALKGKIDKLPVTDFIVFARE